MPKFLQRRGKKKTTGEERSGADRAPVSVLLRAATLRCEQSLRELEASWSFWGDIETARHDPLPSLEGLKKRKGRAENIVWVYVNLEDAALSESNGGWRQTSTKESRAAESKLFCASLQRLRWWHPYLETTAARRGLKTARSNASWNGGGGGDRREKVHNFKALICPLRGFYFQQRSCAPWRSIGAHGSPVHPALLRFSLHAEHYSARRVSRQNAEKRSEGANGSSLLDGNEYKL